MIIFRQACSSKCNSENVLSLKQRLYVLLTSQSTSLKHINLEITNSAGQVRGKEYSQKEVDLLSGLIEKTLSPDNKLYNMIQTRISTYLMSYLNNGVLPKELLYRHNMMEMESEIVTLAAKIKGIVDLNLQTYSEYYKTIFLELKQKKKDTLIESVNSIKSLNTPLSAHPINNSSISTTTDTKVNASPSSKPSEKINYGNQNLNNNITANNNFQNPNINHNTNNNNGASSSAMEDITSTSTSNPSSSSSAAVIITPSPTSSNSTNNNSTNFCNATATTTSNLMGNETLCSLNKSPQLTMISTTSTSPSDNSKLTLSNVTQPPLKNEANLGTNHPNSSTANINQNINQNTTSTTTATTTSNSNNNNNNINIEKNFK